MLSLIDKLPVRKRPPQTLLCRSLGTLLDEQGVELAVDLGCGAGQNTKILAQHTRATMLGVDIDQDRFRLASHSAPKVRWLCADGSHIPLRDSTVGAVIMISAVQHLDDGVAVFRECHRILCSPGLLCIGTLSHEQLLTTPEIRYFPSAIKKAIDRFPRIEALQEELTRCGFAENSCADTPAELVKVNTAFFEGIRARIYSPLRAVPETEMHEGIRRAMTELTGPGQAPTFLRWCKLLVFRKTT